MVFSHRIPRNVKGSPYTVWEEITLSDAEESAVEQEAHQHNLALLRQCLDDAGKIMQDRNMKPFQNDLVQLASELFNKRASHEVFWKEAKCKEKFDQMWKNQ